MKRWKNLKCILLSVGSQSEKSLYIFSKIYLTTMEQADRRTIFENILFYFVLQKQCPIWHVYSSISINYGKNKFLEARKKLTNILKFNQISISKAIFTSVQTTAILDYFQHFQEPYNGIKESKIFSVLKVVLSKRSLPEKLGCLIDPSPHCIANR